MNKEQARALLMDRGLTTHAQALEARVALDVKKWGEAERDASCQQHRRLSHGLLLNSIAHYDVSAPDEDLAAAAGALMTAADRISLRQGG